jgi:hypothetical protein
METTTLVAPDISCEHCQHAIEGCNGYLAHLLALGPVWWRRGVVDSTGVWLSCTWIVVANGKLSVVLNVLPQSASALLAFAITLK